ncbi:MAG: hypothetical protein JSU09_18810 [Bacteroidetes bacterium]|nr:hypothetical protein [Bacteroidota bacterium]
MKGLFMTLARFIFTLSLLLVISVAGHAQPGDPGGDPDVPISGVEWLIGAGGVYGIRKLMKKNKQSDN